MGLTNPSMEVITTGSGMASNLKWIDGSVFLSALYNGSTAMGSSAQYSIVFDNLENLKTHDHEIEKKFLCQYDCNDSK